MSQPTSPSASRKNLLCRVLMLDDSEEVFYVPNKSLGGILFDKVVQKLQLLEADYFDLQYKNVEGILCWLDHEKQITSHMPQNSVNFEFVVKFYTPDPGMLEEELTRYLFALQVKRDLATGRMPCQEQTAALLASYIVQAEFGDLTEESFESNPDYLKSMKFFPTMLPEMEPRIIQHHREHFGQTPSDADYNLLDTARKVEFYGICMHDAKDHEGVALHLAVTHMGVVVFQNMTRINTFSWAKIRKLSFKRKKFLIKLHPEGYGFYKDTVEFYFGSRNECKNFWKKCLEHHAFFRCQSVKKVPRNKTRVVSHGSSFRYSGKTQKQLVDFVRENFAKRPNFLRSSSMRTVSFGGGAPSRTGTLRSLRHSHQPQHDSPFQLDVKSPDRDSKAFSPARVESRSSAVIHQQQQQGAAFSNGSSVLKGTHTLPKQTRQSMQEGPSGILRDPRKGGGEDDEKVQGKIQAARGTSEGALNHSSNQKPASPVEIQPITTTEVLNGYLSYPAHNGSEFLRKDIPFEKGDRERAKKMEEEEDKEDGEEKFESHPVSQLQPQPVTTPALVQNTSTTDIRTDAPTPQDSQSRQIHEQFLFHPEVKQFQQLQESPQQHFLPASPTARFPQYTSTTIHQDDHPVPVASSDTTPTTLTVYSRSINIPLSHQGAQRYFCTDIDNQSPVQSEFHPPQQEHLQHQPDLQKTPSRNEIAECESQIVSEEDFTSHQSLVEITMMRDRQILHLQQQQCMSHSSDFISNVKAAVQGQSDTEKLNQPASGSKVDDAKASTPTKLADWNSFSTVSATISNDTLGAATADKIGSGTTGERFLSVGGPLGASLSSELATSKNLKFAFSVDDVNKKITSTPGDYIGKELLMTERTYRRDLEIVVNGFQSILMEMETYNQFPQSTTHVAHETLRLFTPLFQFHSDFLQLIEQRIAEWEKIGMNLEERKIGDLFASHISMLRIYNYFLGQQEDLLIKTNICLEQDALFRNCLARFEASPTCYLPVSSFQLKPYQRLIHYIKILERFIQIYGNDHVDLENCEESRIAILDVCNSFRDLNGRLVNLQKLCELQQNIVGLSDLLQTRPNFVREGCLQKLSDNGYHQRLFVLFSDSLVYASRKIGGNFQFVLHAYIPLENIQVEVFKKVKNTANTYTTGSYRANQQQKQPAEEEEDQVINNGFLIRVFGLSSLGNLSNVSCSMNSMVIEVAASSSVERTKWIEDLIRTSTQARSRRSIASRKNIFYSTEKLIDGGDTSQSYNSPLSPLSPALLSSSSLVSSLSQPQIPHRINTMMFVCWHRNTSICMAERELAVKNCLSGFLLRKFKTSSGWQKLWVCFTNLCLFFYMSYKDQFPLTSLPLMGYSISPAGESDGIDKSFVFKLTFKSHAYFFRAESQHTFDRWMEVIRSTVESSRHFRLFSRMESISTGPM